MQTIKDQSFGIIPVRKKAGDWEIFLINQFSRIGKNTYWVFPKGHKEGNESPIETANRELKEETGMVAKKILTEDTFELAYNFVFEGKRVEKTVVFFIGLIEEETYKLDPDEVKEAGWFKLSEASQRLDYSDTKEMFKQVQSYLIGRE